MIDDCKKNKTHRRFIRWAVPCGIGLYRKREVFDISWCRKINRISAGELHFCNHWSSMMIDDPKKLAHQSFIEKLCLAASASSSTSLMLMLTSFHFFVVVVFRHVHVRTAEVRLAGPKNKIKVCTFWNESEEKEPNVHKNYITKSHTQKNYTYVHITSTFLFFNLAKGIDENKNK